MLAAHRILRRACLRGPVLTDWLLSTTLVFMIRAKRKHVSPNWLAVALVLHSVTFFGQTTTEEPAPQPALVASLQLAPDIAGQLERAVTAHDYITAQRLLLAEIDRDPHSARTPRLLDYAGVLYFDAHDYLQAAVAWKKSEALAPLAPALKFSLAMAYLQMSHPDWARPVLGSLATEFPRDALYPYWLGRLDYDGHEYDKAIEHFQHAIELDTRMARAYDNLGLCYFYQNQNELALANYQKAIDLQQGAPHPSPWPYLNIAITQQFLNRLDDAEANLHRAIQLDPGFAKAHFQLGTILEDRKQPEDALKELREAAQLDPTYPEPHMAMARILHKLGQEDAARSEVQTYLRLHPHSTP